MTARLLIMRQPERVGYRRAVDHHRTAEDRKAIQTHRHTLLGRPILVRLTLCTSEPRGDPRKWSTLCAATPLRYRQASDLTGFIPSVGGEGRSSSSPPASRRPTLTFAAHEYLGLAILAILTLHWLLHVFGHAPEGLAHFFPWFSRERMRRLAAEARDLLRLKIGEPEAQDAVAGAIQGVGLAIGSLLAITGGLIFLGMADDGTISATVRSIRNVHTTLAPLMWGYLGIHIAATIVHVAVGHRSVLAIFQVRDA